MVFGHFLAKSMINDGVSKVNLSQDWDMYCTLKETKNAVYRVAFQILAKQAETFGE